jgi:hypothetical protein
VILDLVDSSTNCMMGSVDGRDCDLGYQAAFDNDAVARLRSG